MKRKITFFEIDEKEKDFLRDHLEHFADLEFYTENLTKQNSHLAKDSDFVGCFVYSDLSAPVLEDLKQLKGIATMSVGTDHIDIAEAHRRKISVSNVPAYGPQTVAEHAAALMLAISRNIVESVDRTKSGDFDYLGLSGRDLAGKTIGIVGTGKIGAKLCKIAYGLEMKIIGYDPFKNQELVDKWGMEYVELDELLKRADVISLHVPMSDKNKHLLGKREFELMKKGVILINTARGGLIDPQALIEALDANIVYRAGIDVLEEEDILKEEKAVFSPYFKTAEYKTALIDHILMRHPHVIVTPHNAFNSRESMKNILVTTVANMQGFLNNEPVNLVEK